MLEEKWTIRSRSLVNQFCELCGTGSNFLTLDMALQVSGLSTRIILHGVEADEIHAVEAANGQLLICSNSLQNQVGPKPSS